MTTFVEGDSIKLVKKVGKHDVGTEGKFRDYIDDLTAEVQLLDEIKWVTVNITDIEKIS